MKMNELVRIGVVDDHPMVREGIIHVVQRAGGYEVVAQGGCASDVARIADSGNVDVIFVDLNIPGGGLEALKYVISRQLPVRLVVLTISEDEDDVLAAFKNGANAYLVKGITSTELLFALESVVRQGAYISPVLGAKLLAGKKDIEAEVHADSDLLTPREGEIHHMVSRGMSNKEIGRSLDLSEKTVKHHMTRMFRKLNVNNRMKLAMRYHA